MRRITHILIFASCLLVLAASSVNAMDALLGEIVSIDAENRQMIVSVLDADQTQGAREVVVSYDLPKLPGFVQPGAIVRLWGEYMHENRNQFQIQSLRNGAGFHGNDPTGVRSRLKRGHGRHGPGMGMNRGGMRP